MQHLFLASSIGTPGVAASIRRKLGHNRSLKTAFITTPIEVEDMLDDEWYQDDRNALKESGFDFFDYTVTGKQAHDFVSDFADVEAIYISGGNTRHLLKQSQLSGFIPFIQQFVNTGKLYLGTSCGSIIAGPELPKYLWGEEEDAPDLDNFTAYSLVNYTLVPHWGSKIFRDLYLGGRMQEIYVENLQPFLLCNDHEYVEVVGDKYQIIDVRHES